MRKILIVCLLLLSTSVLQADFIQKDKQGHLIGGAIIYTSCYMLSEAIEYKYLNPNTCALLTLGVAVGKEVYDSQHDNHTAEFSDITATMAVPSLHFILLRW